LTSKTLDWEKLIFPDQIDPRWGIIRNTNEIPPENLTKNFADFNAGIAGYGERFFVGFSASHVTRPNEGFISTSKLPVKYTVHAGGVISIESKAYKNILSKKLLYHLIFYFLNSKILKNLTMDYI